MATERTFEVMDIVYSYFHVLKECIIISKQGSNLYEIRELESREIKLKSSIFLFKKNRDEAYLLSIIDDDISYLEIIKRELTINNRGI